MEGKVKLRRYLLSTTKKKHTHKQQIDTHYLSKILILDLFNPTIH